jgi:hypothetical protein
MSGFGDRNYGLECAFIEIGTLASYSVLTNNPLNLAWALALFKFVS